MKPLLFCLLVLPCLFNNAKAQTIEEQLKKTHPTCNDVFLNAVEIFPTLYRQKAFDSMHTAINIWKDACGDNDKITCTSLLLSIQQTTFKKDSLSAFTISVLENYARSFSFYKRYTSPYYKNEAAFYKFISIWAKLLMAERRLDGSEKFICSVFTGDITDPATEIKHHAEEYPELAALVQQKEKEQRKRSRVNGAFLIGTWVPNGDLKIIGNHPAIGFQWGTRKDKQEIDFTMQFRFIKSANPYLIKRNNTMYQSDHFFGGYIGFDYTCYLLSNQKNDLGVMAGIGFDGFDVSKSNDQSLRPLSINAFNANGGLRYNFYVTPTFYLGLQGRYNVVNYCNSGGSSLQGNAFSIDLIIGGYHSRYGGYYSRYGR
ncbi:MAG: hypothetical protein JWR61_1646 [Ferruginibacter sp.]|nr:hypothetical protein [Ferruginibacter sp.]